MIVGNSGKPVAFSFGIAFSSLVSITIFTFPQDLPIFDASFVLFSRQHH